MKPMSLLIFITALLMSVIPIMSHAQNVTPSITIQNDTDKNISGGYVADIVNENYQTRKTQDTFTVPPGTTTTNPLQFYLINQRLYFTDDIEDCISTVSFHVENRGNAFRILEGTAVGKPCVSNGLEIVLNGTVLRDGFSILLIEEKKPAHNPPQ